MSELSRSTTDRMADSLRVALDRLERARPLDKLHHQRAVLDIVARLAQAPDGLERVFALAPRFDAAGLFTGSDWDAPERLRPQLVSGTLDAGDPALAALEVASLMRMLAIATDRARHQNLHTEAARHFLTQVLALNLRHFFGAPDEAERESSALPRAAIFRYIANHVGLNDVLGALVSEIWRILDQRPVQTGPIKNMIAQISVAMARDGFEAGQERLGADRLVSALFGPTAASQDDPGIAAYRERLEGFDETALRQEAMGFARAMHDTGLVSDYHAIFVRWTATQAGVDLLPEALGLGTTGADCLRRWRNEIGDIIDRAITEYTPQAVLGLSLLLDRGILHHPAMIPALRQQLTVTPSPAVAECFALAFGSHLSPEAWLLSGTLAVLGQPLGVGQGANPTCQSARAIAIWSLASPDFLLDLVRQAAGRDSILMHFEGDPIASQHLPAGLAAGAAIDADPVSVLLVPHMDRIYAEMGRRCSGRPGDPHRWINREFHGWWVARDCAVAVDVETGRLSRFDRFVNRFRQSYHPDYNGQKPLIHPQPAGVAVTDSAARFVGWHAIAILRVVEDQTGTMRVYFYNPNNDSGQDWGNGVEVSTSGCGERFGEASLPFEQFAARLYLFHDDPEDLEMAEADTPPEPDDMIARIRALAETSWASARLPVDEPLSGASEDRGAV